MSGRTIKLPILAAAVLVILAATLAFAGEGMAPAATPVAATAAAAAPAGCGADLDLASLAAPSPAVCPAATPESAVPDFIPMAGGRTCRCSCGSPCKQDSDCGPGGRCTAGITCC